MLGLGVFGTGGLKKPALLVGGFWLLVLTLKYVLLMLLLLLLLLLFLLTFLWLLLLKVVVADVEMVLKLFGGDGFIFTVADPGGRHISNPGVPPTVGAIRSAELGVTGDAIIGDDAMWVLGIGE